MSRPWAIAALLALTGCASQPEPVLHKGAAWLWSRQEADGGWHSHTYGLLRSGQSLTPFVLDALLDVPEDVCARPHAGVDRAIAFMRGHTQPTGAMGTTDRDIPDYPNYATALAVSALCRARHAGWQAQTAPMVAYLRLQQFTEQNRWRPPGPGYGAGGLGGERRNPAATGPRGPSPTRSLPERLAAAGAARS